MCGLLAEDPFSVLTLCLLSAMNNSFERKRAAEMESCFSFLYLGIGIKETFPNFLTVYCLCGFKEEASNSLEEKGNIKGLKKKVRTWHNFCSKPNWNNARRILLSNSNWKNCIL